MKKLFAFDMDGTILDDSEKIKQETVEAIISLKQKGHIAVIATGRPYADALRSLKDEIHLFDFAICNNGSYCKDINNNHNVAAFPAIPQKLIKKAIKIGKENSCFIAIHGNNEAKKSLLGDKSKTDWTTRDLGELNIFKKEYTSIEDALKWAEGQTVFQCSLASDIDTINKIKPLFDADKNEVEIHIANKVYLDINPKGASKLAGLEKLTNSIGLKLNDVIAFGDSGNDLQMLSGVGHGLCMGNGSEDAKEAADEVIGDNNSAAISKKIFEILN